MAMVTMVVMVMIMVTVMLMMLIVMMMLVVMMLTVVMVMMLTVVMTVIVAHLDMRVFHHHALVVILKHLDASPRQSGTVECLFA